ncbi:rhomboid family intramembrane serine protease [Tropicimonas isoalkanivorans]|uniref:Membrane associated serine protease, rhomboid family n=1 Tax=Tropicimonas isoalkanivorans TaxID=441112 RepID=A0A1I1NJB4_9RHOB|nr:rhomboid family intramembrane serine protease [Tropicimonas isoalkanivorans]SFC97731.1 Membrane associated serine protease, rhomboid family [Tropicimonas isoalkanivorans]
MFPIRDHNPSGRTPYVTYALIVVNVGIFFANWNLMLDDRALMQFYAHYALIPAYPSPHAFITSMFLHGSILHLLGNMLFLWIFGDNLEDEFGHVGFLLFYLGSGVVAGIAQVALSPGSMVPTVGASGAIAGVMGGYLLMFPRARIDILVIIIIIFRIITVPAWLMLFLWFGIQIVGAAAADPDLGGVAYGAHAGGFVAGVILTLLPWMRRGGTAFWANTHGVPPHPPITYGRTEIPAVRRKRR